MHRILVPVVAAAALCLAGSAQALTLDFELPDVAISATGDFVALGGDQDITGFVTLDEGAIDANGDPSIGFYTNAVTDFGLSIGGTAFLDISNLAFSNLFVTSGTFSEILLGLDFDSTLVPGGPIDFGSLGISILLDPALPGDSVPSAEDVASRSVIEVKGGGGFQINPTKVEQTFVPGGSALNFNFQNGTVTPRVPSNPIPEPTGALLFAGGLLVAARAVRKRGPA